jgi:hypothetical protein
VRHYLRRWPPPRGDLALAGSGGSCGTSARRQLGRRPRSARGMGEASAADGGDDRAEHPQAEAAVTAKAMLGMRSTRRILNSAAVLLSTDVSPGTASLRPVQHPARRCHGDNTAATPDILGIVWVLTAGVGAVGSAEPGEPAEPADHALGRSRATVPSPPATTSSPTATRPPSTSPPATIGCPAYETHPGAVRVLSAADDPRGRVGRDLPRMRLAPRRHRNRRLLQREPLDS